MRLVDQFPFYAELSGPVHTRQLRNKAELPAPDEVVIDETWAVVLGSNDPPIRTAKQDLTSFLEVSMGVRLAPLARGPVIRLEVDRALTGGPEAHRIEVGSEHVEVRGASPAGVLHGVFFVEDIMRSRRAPFLPKGILSRAAMFERRIHRSCMSPFLVEELTGQTGPPMDVEGFGQPIDYTGWQHTDAGPDAFYHDNILARLAHHGANGIWLRGALCRYAKASSFPEFGERADEVVAQLNRLCNRAARYGIRVYVYFNEPLGFPSKHEFWQHHADCKGSYCAGFDRYCMCTSVQAVKDFLRDGMAWLFSHVPDLGGVILITASEFPTHCYCHIPTAGGVDKAKLVEQGILCPRCAEREPQEIIGEIVTLIRDGIRSASPAADVIAWNWSWAAYEEDPQAGILERLPDDVIVMGDFERGIMSSACGFEYLSDEYSLKIVGPSDRFRKMAEFLKARGRKVYAKLQIGTTHELASVPYLPVMQRIAAKYAALKPAGVEGMMTCWNFGNMPSLATELAGMMSWAPQPGPDQAVEELAARHFGVAAAAQVVEGWRLLSEAMEDFPGSIPVLYNYPANRGPAFPFVLERIGRGFPASWLLERDIDADDPSGWAVPFGPEHALKCLRSLCEKWEKGVDVLEAALLLAEGADRAELEREVGVARMCLIQFRSAANVTDFLLTRKRWYEATDVAEREALKRRMLEIMEDERRNCEAALPLVDADPRLGFHGEAYGYMYNRELIERKLARLEDTRKQLIATD